jgi:hypothetical protein
VSLGNEGYRLLIFYISYSYLRIDLYTNLDLNNNRLRQRTSIIPISSSSHRKVQNRLVAPSEDDATNIKCVGHYRA